MKQFILKAYIGSIESWGTKEPRVTEGTLAINIHDKELAKLKGHNVEVGIQILKDLGPDSSLDYMKKRKK